jgi:hypothetical protein
MTLATSMSCAIGKPLRLSLNGISIAAGYGLVMNQPLKHPVAAVELSPLEALVQQVFAAISAPPAELSPSVPLTMRERFVELLVLSLANLYGKTPIAAAPFDRNMVKLVAEGLDDNDTGKFTSRTDDWIRLEGLVRVQEGQKTYMLNRAALAVLSTSTSRGTLGEVMESIFGAYNTAGPTPQLRQATRQIGAYFLTRLGRTG